MCDVDLIYSFFCEYYGFCSYETMLKVEGDLKFTGIVSSLLIKRWSVVGN